MESEANNSGRPAVMLSSTFKDLVDLRQVLMNAALGAGLFPEAMEHDEAKTIDVVQSSLDKVGCAAAYVLLIGQRYGQQPVCDKNPKQASITEMEFDEAMRLGLPIILFLLSDDYPISARHVETDPVLRGRLQEFRKRAKSANGQGTGPNRVYAEVNSPAEFQQAAERSLQQLAQELKKKADAPPAPAPAPPQGRDALPPAPPALHAVPAYIGSHDFIGRDAELAALDDWSAAEDAHPMLLFDAIGGSGKSMLTWHWLNTRAPNKRSDWAGRFWYSFYEPGASMADFCRHALAYLTHRPASEWRTVHTTELARELLLRLRERPWLLVLDGMERVLVAYNRSDAATLADEALETPTDQIANRNPCAAARPDDDDLLRQLAAAAPSKILVTTRLVPQALLNAAHQPIPGVRREPLRGLRPEDAARLLQAAGVHGDTTAMQRFLQANCDGHPLVIGVLAGLIVDFVAAPGDFDVWEKHADGGAALDLSTLDLVRKRNHILHAALEKVPEAGRQLLGTLALLHGGVDREAIEELNPHRPPEPNAVDEPEQPEAQWRWKYLTDEGKHQRRLEYAELKAVHGAYLEARGAWQESPELKTAPTRLATTLRDLRRRGLLQEGEGAMALYDLHPVVRGVVSGDLAAEDTQQLGQRVVDHFSRRSHRPYEQAETMQDLEVGFHLVRTLLKMGRFYDALDAWKRDLADASDNNVGLGQEVLALLKPFFPLGWLEPINFDNFDRSVLLGDVAAALINAGLMHEALQVYDAKLLLDAAEPEALELHIGLANLSSAFQASNHLGRSHLCLVLSSRVTAAAANMTEAERFVSLLDAYGFASLIGDWSHAEALWTRLHKMGRDWPRLIYAPGDAEAWRVASIYWQGASPVAMLDAAESVARRGNVRRVLRTVLTVRGEWLLGQSQPAAAIGVFEELLALVRSSGRPDHDAESWLALARHQAGWLPDARAEAERLHSAKVFSWPLAKLWQAVSDLPRAREVAFASYRDAWGDGEPYVRRFDLDRARALLLELGEPIPDLPRYDPAAEPRFPWQDAVEAAITALEAQKAERDAKAARNAATRKS